MEECISRGKEILRILTNNGFEAYFIGEVVRNTILDKEIKRVDITTSAHIDVIKSIFKNCETEDIDENSIKLYYSNYEFIISTFIFSDGIDKNTLLSKHYSKNLLDDLANRDYTINAIAMSHSGKLTDAYSGFNDLQKKRIAHIGNAKIRFSKDPILMLKAFSLISELNYKIVKKTKTAIIKRRKCLENIQIDKYKVELQKIFEGPYAKRALKQMEVTKIYKNIPELKKVIKRLNEKYRPVLLEEALLMSSVLDGKINDRFQNVIENYDTYVMIFTLAKDHKKAKFDNQTLFNNGLEICLEANRINYLLGKDKKREKKIKKQWDKLPIHDLKDIDYKDTDLMRIINKSDFSKISDVFDNVAMAIINGTLSNVHAEIETYILSLLPKFNILYDLNGLTDVEEYLKHEEKLQEDEELKYNDEDNVFDFNDINNSLEENNEDINNTDTNLEGNLTNHRLDMLEQKFEEQARLIKEKELKLQEMENQRLKNDIDLIVNNTIDYLKSNDGLKNLIKDTDDFKELSQRFIYDYIKDQGDE